MTRALLLLLLLPIPCPAGEPFGIRLVDEATDRGVPLIELKTTGEMRLTSDSQGWVAFDEPGLMDREVHFEISGPGYQVPADGFGFRGVRLRTTPGRTATVKLRRTQVAQRLTRLTGQGIERDAALLNQPLTHPRVNLMASVTGQDSVQVVPYRGKLFWLWGDTNLTHYPLGNFQTTAATTAMPAGDATPYPWNYDYFADPRQPERPRAMVPLPEPGPVWLFGLLSLKEDGREVLLAHFTRRKDLAEQLEHGLVRFSDEKAIFERVSTLPLGETWRFPRGNAVRFAGPEGDHFYFAAPFPHTRVRAELKSILDPTSYEAFRYDPTTKQYAWQRTLPPTTQTEEVAMLQREQVAPDAARFQVRDERGESVEVHGGSLVWHARTKRWLLLALRKGGKHAASHLGEVYLAHSAAITGPWSDAIQVATHPGYSFYNPRLHPFLTPPDEQALYFEGTFTHTFSGNPRTVPRYEYNQLLYRIDLTDPRLKPLFR